MAYFCRQCGDVWARIVMLDAADRQQAFTAENVACEKHHDQWNVAGSLLANELEGLLPYLPPAALKREFMLLLKQQETQDEVLNSK